MPIGTSDGKQYEDEFDYALANANEYVKNNFPQAGEKRTSDALAESKDYMTSSAVVPPVREKYVEFNWQKHFDMLAKMGKNYKAPPESSEGSENIVDRQEGEQDEESRRHAAVYELGYQHAMEDAIHFNKNNSGGPLARAAGYNDIAAPENLKRYAEERKEILKERQDILKRLRIEIAGKEPDIAARWGAVAGLTAGKIEKDSTKEYDIK